MNSKKSRVLKLIAKMESTEFESEREALQEKILELMQTYEITEHELGSERAKEELGEIVSRTTMWRKGTYAREYTSLGLWIVNGIGQCKGHMVQYSQTEYELFLAGYEADIDMNLLLVESITNQCERDLKAWIKEYRDTWTYQRMSASQRTNERKGFIRMFAHTVYKRLQAKHSKMQHGPGSGLILAKDANVDRFYRNQGVRVRQSRTRSGASREAYNQGAASANRADIGNSRLGGSRLAIG